MRLLKNWKLLSLLMFGSLLMWSCDLGDICERGEGATVSQSLELPSFHSVNLNISAEVIIQQGDEQQVVVTGQENIINLIELDVRNSTWNIDFDKSCVSNYNDLTYISEESKGKK